MAILCIPYNEKAVFKISLLLLAMSLIAGHILFNYNIGPISALIYLISLILAALTLVLYLWICTALMHYAWHVSVKYKKAIVTVIEKEHNKNKYIMEFDDGSTQTGMGIVRSNRLKIGDSKKLPYKYKHGKYIVYDEPNMENIAIATFLLFLASLCVINLTSVMAVFRFIESVK